MVTLAISIVGGAAFGVAIGVMSARWRAPGRWAWQLPIGLVVIAGLTVWAWNTGDNAFPATFGPFTLAIASVAGITSQQNRPS
ncbi:hypothetical protein [Rugosimonospora africana]|uniref:Uncharacterized protein n=1 Tax=Rugosimonospora africana TaxID=556532 RepID=A0A8J3R4L5_9ACTN|nr:hypothetical protein [Rugosimonospora africana]GIH21689.1 hypothetical protein Raf01_98610 [Rugosimonospora africana]